MSGLGGNSNDGAPAVVVVDLVGSTFQVVAILGVEAVTYGAFLLAKNSGLQLVYVVGVSESADMAAASVQKPLSKSFVDACHPLIRIRETPARRCEICSCHSP